MGKSCEYKKPQKEKENNRTYKSMENTLHGRREE
jgi:hypothetical protein